ncbi:MAG: response regulator [Blastocatellia bacterium]
MNQQNQIRILVVDDHYVVRLGVAAGVNVEPDMTVIAEAKSGEEAVAQFRQHRPDVTLMDLRLPGMSGVATTAAIISEFPDARIIVLSTYDHEEPVFRALQAGARGWLLKSSLGADLQQAIRAVHAGGKYLTPEIEARLAERRHHTELSAREAEILKLMATGKSNREIGDAVGLTQNTVKTHVANILAKLGVNDRTLAVTTALQRGLIFLD